MRLVILGLGVVAIGLAFASLNTARNYEHLIDWRDKAIDRVNTLSHKIDFQTIALHRNCETFNQNMQSLEKMKDDLITVERALGIEAETLLSEHKALRVQAREFVAGVKSHTKKIDQVTNDTQKIVSSLTTLRAEFAGVKDNVQWSVDPISRLSSAVPKNLKSIEKELERFSDSIDEHRAVLSGYYLSLCDLIDAPDKNSEVIKNKFEDLCIDTNEKLGVIITKHLASEGIANAILEPILQIKNENGKIVSDQSRRFLLLLLFALDGANEGIKSKVDWSLNQLLQQAGKDDYLLFREVTESKTSKSKDTSSAYNVQKQFDYDREFEEYANKVKYACDSSENGN